MPQFPRPHVLLKRIYERQNPPRRSPDYQPLIRANRQEAPSISRASQLFVPRLKRHVHLLSEPEVAAASLALHHPNLFELQEQRVMSPIPAAHPLQSFDEARGLQLPGVPGTLTVAEELGSAKLHHWALVPGRDGVSVPCPVPYSSDLLLFLTDGAGPYCVAWSVKPRPSDHGRPGPGSLRRQHSQSAIQRARFRDQLEERYYRRAGIAFHRVSHSGLDTTLISNLRMASIAACGATSNSDLEDELLDRLQASLNSRTLPLLACRAFSERYRVDFRVCAATFYRLVWERRLRIDLFEPLQIDRAMEPEHTDPLLVYEDLFRRA